MTELVSFEYRYLVDEKRAKEIRAFFQENAALDLDSLMQSDQPAWKKARKLALFVHESVPHDNQKEELKDKNAITLWQYSQRIPTGFNCRWHAILLSELLLSIGIKNRFVTCMSQNRNDGDCHVVNLVWLPEYDKWAMIDSDLMEYVTDDNGIPLSLEEMQNEVSAGRNLNIAIDADPKSIMELQSYWAKNLYCFANHTAYAFDLEDLCNVEDLYLCYVPSKHTCPNPALYDAITTNATAFWEKEA